jgi:hypothetical protein
MKKNKDSSTCGLPALLFDRMVREEWKARSETGLSMNERGKGGLVSD